MKVKWLIWGVFVVTLMMFGSFQLIFTTRATPEVTSIHSGNVATELKCHQSDSAQAIDDAGRLNILVWNIYKQNRENLLSELERLSKGKQLALLQEANLDAPFLQWLKNSSWSSQQASAFKAFDVSAGVLNLSTHMPSIACANLQVEPWLRLPKSGLYAEYALSNGTKLITVNLHSVNFTVGTEEYQAQLESFKQVLISHKGALLIAGDFNSWSEERLEVLRSVLKKYHIKEVTFKDDNRKRFITGLPLDHIFYRGMTLLSSSSPPSTASDHNPMMAEFRLD
ncbi:endonuclease/exonuclease/phosphatase family protein [Vibrio nomapromontoriensis]|uniref:endonuclease/exonuclease/phosphatase family protein n=1 Tax=Vibrio nomapromontoriensis TaxID=2910246 RepID=UPI003D0AA3C8